MILYMNFTFTLNVKVHPSLYDTKLPETISSSSSSTPSSDDYKTFGAMMMAMTVKK